MGSLLWPLVVVLLLCMCHCWTLTYCSPRPRVFSMIIDDTIQNTTNHNATEVDYNTDLPAQNASEYSSDDYREVFSSAQRKDNRARDREMRKETIRSIMTTLRFPNSTNSTSPPLDENYRKIITQLLAKFPFQTATQDFDNTYAKKAQSFFPSCTIPRNTDKDVWENEEAFQLYYDISSLEFHASQSVSSAKLRLYKYESSVIDTTTESTVLGSLQQDGRDIETDYIPGCDERFRVSVYQYIRPLKKSKRAKKIKKLIDSRMMTMDFVGWLEFDIKSSVRDWIENPNKNYGLEIVVEDTVEKMYNPSQFFQNMNCSADDYNRLTDNVSLPFDYKTFPTLALSTVEPFEVDTTTIINDVISRKKRQSTENCSASDIFHKCCMINVYVSFEDWKYIIAPPGFYTGHCIGRCVNETPKATSKNSCKPHGKASLSVLMMDNDERVILVNLPEVITTSCRCSKN